MHRLALRRERHELAWRATVVRQAVWAKDDKSFNEAMRRLERDDDG